MDDDYERFQTCYCVAATFRTQLDLPPLIYAKQVEGQYKIIAREYEEYRKTTYVPIVKILKESEPLKFGSLYLGMYNATIDTMRLIDIPKLAENLVALKLKGGAVNGFKYKPIKIVARYGKFLTSFEYTAEYGLKVNKRVPDEKLSSIEILIRITKGGHTQGASFVIFNTGRIRFSAGYIDGTAQEPVNLIKFVSDNYFPINKNANFMLNNVTSEFKIGLKLKVSPMFSLFDAAITKGISNYKGYNIESEYGPERVFGVEKSNKRNTPYLYLKFKKPDDKFTLLCSPYGTIQIMGNTDVQRIYRMSTEFFELMRQANLLVNRKNQIVPVIKPVEVKIARRLNMQPAPDVTRRGTSCPVGRRPNPYGFQGKCPGGDKFFVKPNPQGQPCCYKCPKSISYSRNKVANIYEKANVKVPDNVRKIFGIGKNTNNKLNNIGQAKPNITVTFDRTIGKGGKPVGLKINSRQGMRYSRVALVDIAQRLGVVLPSKFVSKPGLCKLIEDKMKPAPSIKETYRITRELIKKNLSNLAQRSVSENTVTNFIKYLKVHAKDVKSKNNVNKFKKLYTNKNKK
jgi:hypothetical protein